MKVIPSEHDEQVAVFEWATIAQNKYPQLSMLYAVPNGGHRHKAVAGKLKAEGVKSGVPDICLPVARGGYHGLYIEMKRIKGGKVEDNQRWWHEMLQREGYLVVVCKGAGAAINVIGEYLDTKQ